MYTPVLGKVRNIVSEVYYIILLTHTDITLSISQQLN